MAADQTPEHVPEAQLAGLLGLDRSVLVEARTLALKEGEHWQRQRSVIAYTPAGIAALCTHLHLEIPADFAPEKKDAAPLALTVVRLARHNPHIIFAAEKDGAPEIPVRVRDAQAFRPGQAVVVIMEGELGRLAGKQPRARGGAR